MGQIHKVTCDHCGGDLTYTRNCVGYSVVLQNRSIPNPPGTGTVTMMHIYQPLDRAYDFCGTPCLEKWVNKGGLKSAGGAP